MTTAPLPHLFRGIVAAVLFATAVWTVVLVILSGVARAADPTGVSVVTSNLPAYTAASNPALIERAKVVAMAYWHSPLPVTIRVMSKAQLDTERNAEARSAGVTDSRSARADGDPRTRTVRIAWEYTNGPVDLCAEITHETGHVEGREHSPDPLNVMYFGALTPPAACMAAFPAKRVTRLTRRGYACRAKTSVGRGFWKCRRGGSRLRVEAA